ncbi:MAG: M6 family metalloprotease domain-containing protein [Acidobacteriota bacterium]
MLGISSVEANPVFGKPYPLVQPDGTVLPCVVWGDEIHRRVEMPNGYSVVPNSVTGWYEYGKLENGRLLPSGLVAGYASDEDLGGAGLTAHLSDRHAVAAEALQRKAELRKRQAALNPDQEEPAARRAVTGSFKNLVMCVDFKAESDPPTKARHKYATSLFKTALYATTGQSMVTYYKENSYGTFKPSGYVYPNWIVLPQTASYYKAMGDSGWRQIISDAMDVIRTANPTFNFNAWANGTVLNPIVIWAGQTEGWSDFFWPHQGEFTLSKNGVTVNGYLAVNEQDVSSSGTVTANTDLGTFCHEFGHMIGAPDLYDYDAFQALPNGFYCLMGIGSATTHICGFIKWKYFGWVTPVELAADSTGMTFPVSALALQAPTKPRLYRVKINGSNKEYFLIENREDGTGVFENFLYGGGWTRKSGLHITHVDENMFPAVYTWIVNLGFSTTYPSLSHKFYGVEAVTPSMPATINELMAYLYLWGDMVFSKSLGYTKLTPIFPINRAPGKFATVYYAQNGVLDTEHLAFPNTNGHTALSHVSFTTISNPGNVMSFKFLYQ